MGDLETALAHGFALFQRGDLAGARAATAAFIGHHATDPRLAALEGQVLLASGDHAAAIGHLRNALAAAPHHPQLRLKLATALAGAGAALEARRIATSLPVGPEAGRLIAFLDQQRGDTAGAIAGYRAVVAMVPQDHASWHILAHLLRRVGDLPDAVAASERAVALQPGNVDYRLVQAALLADAGRFEERRATLRAAARKVPDSASLWTELAVAEAALDDFAAAEEAFDRALALDSSYANAYRERAMVFDRLGDLDALQELLARAAANGLTAAEIAFPTALLHFRHRRLDAAADWLGRVGDDVNPARVFQLKGDVADARGRYDEAFGAYAAMNAASAAEPLAAQARARDYPTELAAEFERIEAAGRQPKDNTNHGLEPIFILGFPRSGTTLLDTLLRNLPDISVLEEPPMLEAAAAVLASCGTAPTADDVRRARATYVDTLEALAPRAGAARRVVDKFPLHLARVSTIYHLFPGAPIVFVERHPCDVVLSCYFARFQNNKAMVQFQDLAATARLYDLCMQLWTRAEERLTLHIHRIRYERMIATLEPEMRGLMSFLDLPWNPAVLDNERAAAARPLIATASFAQVTQPIHARSVARWRRYAQHLAPVMPLLSPWIERLGYDA